MYIDSIDDRAEIHVGNPHRQQVVGIKPFVQFTIFYGIAMRAVNNRIKIVFSHCGIKDEFTYKGTT